MKLSEYFKHQGRGAAMRLANAIGSYPSDVSDWVKGNRPIPVKFAVAIEVATGKAVTRQELFPNDWRAIWPELAAPTSPRTDPEEPDTEHPKASDVVDRKELVALIEAGVLKDERQHVRRADDRAKAGKGVAHG